MKPGPKSKKRALTAANAPKIAAPVIPICQSSLKAIDGAEFDQWQTEQVSLKVAAVAEASSDKTWELEGLMTKGQAVYASNWPSVPPS